jgi:hypothetical protein
MLSIELKQEIERHAQEIGAHRLMLDAHNGDVPPQTVVRYLSGARELVRATPWHLELARSRARELALPELEAFFEHKLAEEQGHERWAESDLAAMSERFRTAPALLPSPAIRSLLGFLETVIRSDPYAYLPYILLAEYATVLMGPAWTQALREKCSIPPNALSVVDRHAELDKHHVAEALAEIDRLLEEHRDPTRLRQTLFTAMSHFMNFLDELAGTAPGSGDSDCKGVRAA